MYESLLGEEIALMAYVLFAACCMLPLFMTIEAWVIQYSKELIALKAGIISFANKS